LNQGSPGIIEPDVRLSSASQDDTTQAARLGNLDQLLSQSPEYSLL